MHRLFALIILSIWITAFAFLACQCWLRVAAEFQAQVWWLMLLMAFFGLACTVMLCRFAKLFKDVATGHISPRLSARVIRNILADGLFFFKTGWKG
jgi:hypothetical protein